MIEIINKQTMKKDDLNMIITLYKEDSGCYRYSLNQAYQRSGAATTTQNRDYSAGALKSNAMMVFEKVIDRMIKKGYEKI